MDAELVTVCDFVAEPCAVPKTKHASKDRSQVGGVRETHAVALVLLSPSFRVIIEGPK